MKKTLYRKCSDPAHGFKSLAIINRSSDSQSQTTVVKKFQYDVDFAEPDQTCSSQPVVHIRKNRDTKNQIEWFQFDVEGEFLMRYKRHQMIVKFRHCLKIKVSWHSKQLSSKKSEILT